MHIRSHAAEDMQSSHKPGRQLAHAIFPLFSSRKPAGEVPLSVPTITGQNHILSSSEGSEEPSAKNHFCLISTSARAPCTADADKLKETQCTAWPVESASGSFKTWKVTWHEMVLQAHGAEAWLPRNAGERAPPAVESPSSVSMSSSSCR